MLQQHFLAFRGYLLHFQVFFQGVQRGYFFDSAAAQTQTGLVLNFTGDSKIEGFFQSIFDIIVPQIAFQRRRDFKNQSHDSAGDFFLLGFNGSQDSRGGIGFLRLEFNANGEKAAGFYGVEFKRHLPGIAFGLYIYNIKAFFIVLFTEVDTLQAAGVDYRRTFRQDLLFVDMPQGYVVEDGQGNRAKQENRLLTDGHHAFRAGLCQAARYMGGPNTGQGGGESGSFTADNLRYRFLHHVVDLFQVEVLGILAAKERTAPQPGYSDNLYHTAGGGNSIDIRLIGDIDVFHR